MDHHKNIKNFLKKIIKDLNDLKAIDVKFIDIKNRSALGDFLLIVTGNSSRHINAIATKLIENLKKQVITVKIISTDSKGLIVRPEGCEMNFPIKKANIAINAADTRTSRFTGGERIDCAIADLDVEKRKVTLSIKLLEEIEKKEALEKYGAEGSGKNLPFSSLSEDLKKKDKK